MRVLGCILLLSITIHLVPAQGRLERNILLPADDDSSKVNLLNRMALSLRESDHEMALKYSEQALALSEKLNYVRGKANALENMGWISYRKSDYVNSLQYSFEAIKLSEQIGDKEKIAQCTNNIAAVYYEQKQVEKSLSQFRKALALSNEIGSEKLTSRTLNNMGYVFLMGLKQPDSALLYTSRALQKSEKIKDSYLTSFALRTLGDVAEGKGDLKKAMEFYKKGIAMAESGRSNSMRTSALHRLAKVYISLNRIEEAKSILLENAKVASDLVYPEELERTYKVLAELYHRQGDEGKAYAYLQKYTILHDSIFTRHSSEQLALLQSQFDLDLKQAQIELLTKDAALKQEEISSQRMQLYVTILASSCGLLLVIVLLYSFQQVKKSNRELQKQKEELASKNEEIQEKSEELTRLNDTKDKLFSIIGHDFRSPLHSLKGLLGLIGNKNMTQEEFEFFSADLKKKIDIVYDNLDNILNWSVAQLRGIQTKTTTVHLQPLVIEVFELYQEMARSKNVALTNEVEDNIYVKADKDQIRLVLRNLLSNALKFTSSFGYVKAGARVKAHEVSIFVEDSGIGIAPDDLQKLFVKDSLWSIKGTQNEKGLGLGLLLCKEFVEKNDGSLTIKSKPGEGTTITFTLPLVSSKEIPSRDFVFEPSQKV